MAVRILPIGTIVKLKEIDKFAMISGYYPVSSTQEGNVRDYSAFPFPEGMVDNDKVIQFDNDAVERIIVMGYQDEYQIGFVRVLASKEEEIKSYYKNDNSKTDSEVSE